MRPDRFERDIARLEAARLRSRQIMDQQQRRLDERFARMQEKLDRKAGKPSLSQQKIIEAALELLAEDGLANITLRKLAAKLDMQAPALYWHFKNKEVLVDFMAEAMLHKEFKDLQVRDDDESWQDWLMGRMKQLRSAMLAYPDGGRVVAGAHLWPAVTLAQLFETSFVSLQTAGIDPQTARHLIMTATHYTFGSVIEEQSAPTDEQMANMDIESVMGQYPNMMATANEAHRQRTSDDEDFLTGLRYIINGSLA